jgi:hypothetical protein
VVLTGAAVIREREHGTLEHLLVMPLTAFEIAMAKVWANSLVILVATGASLFLVVQMVLKVPFAGSVTLWFLGVVLYLFFATALGIFLGTISRSMAHPGDHGPDAAFGRQHAGGEPAEVAPVPDVPVAGPSLRQLLAGDHLPRGRPESGLAPVPDGVCGWAGVLRVQPGPVPEIDRRFEVAPRPSRARQIRNKE